MGNYLGLLGSFASIVGFFMIDTENKILKVVFISLMTIIVIVVGILDFKNCQRPKVFENEEKNVEFLCEWINKSSQVVIVTRDMTWLNSLSRKAKLFENKKNITICIDNNAPINNELEKNGFNLYHYGKYFPENRFTIIKACNSIERQVAIMSTKKILGKEKRFVYILDEKSSEIKDKWIVGLAFDLYNMIMENSNIRNDNESKKN